MNMSPVLLQGKAAQGECLFAAFAAGKVIPAVFFSASLTVSRLRSSIRRSVTTVTDCGMSRNCCLPCRWWSGWAHAVFAFGGLGAFTHRDRGRAAVCVGGLGLHVQRSRQHKDGQRQQSDGEAKWRKLLPRARVALLHG